MGNFHVHAIESCLGNKCKILLLQFLFFPVFQGVYAQITDEIHITDYSEKTVIHSLAGGYTTYYSITGNTSAPSFFMPLMLDKGTGKLSDFSLYYKKKNRYKPAENANLIATPANTFASDYHTSNMINMVELEGNVQFKCTFRVDWKTTMLCDATNLSAFYETDTARYLISMPSNLTIKFDSVLFDSLTYHHIYPYSKNDSQYLSIKVKPYLLDTKQEIHAYPVVRQIIIPAEMDSLKEKYFNDWYIACLDSLNHLDKQSVKTVDSLAAGIKDARKLTGVYYNFIRDHFKYLNIELGLGAFIPRNVNVILKNRQGDCKDLANLLCAMLRYKGIDARIAVASTIMHFCDFTFPSFISGDHLICVVYEGEKIILLDPTDDNHEIGQPVESLQGRTIFILGENGPAYYKVPQLEPDQNQFRVSLDLSATSNGLSGNYEILLTGFAGNPYKWSAVNKGQNEIREIFRKKLREILQNQSINDFTYSIHGDSVCFKGNVKYSNKYYKSGQVAYLYLDYIPVLFNNDLHKNKIKNEEIMGCTIRKILDMKVNFGEPVTNVEYKPLNEEKDNYAIDFQVTSEKNNTVRVWYSFDFKKIRFEKKDFPELNSLITKFNQKTNETVVIHL
jgi:hypothetical protein